MKDYQIKLQKTIAEKEKKSIIKAVQSFFHFP